MKRFVSIFLRLFCFQIYFLRLFISFFLIRWFFPPFYLFCSISFLWLDTPFLFYLSLLICLLYLTICLKHLYISYLFFNISSSFRLFHRIFFPQTFFFLFSCHFSCQLIVKTFLPQERTLTKMVSKISGQNFTGSH